MPWQVVNAIQLLAGNTVINLNGMFIYNGTPAAGNIPIFVVAVPGVTTDPFGNSITAVVEIGQQSGGHWHWDSSGNLDVNNTSSALIATWRPTDQALLMFAPGGGAGQMVIALASAAGTNTYGDTYVQGLQVGKSGDTAQIQLIPGSGGAAQIKFPMPSLTLQNVANIAGGISASTAEMIVSGPALSTVGQRDWVQMIMFSNDTIGDQARLELRYINDAQSPAVMMAMNGNTGVTFHSSVSIDAGDGPFVTGETFHTITGAAGLTGTLRIKKVPWNMVYLDVLVSWTATAATTFTCGSLPDATYYPTVNDPGSNTLLPLESNAAWNTDAQARVFIPTSGAIQVIVGASAAGGNGCFRGFYATN